MHSSRMRTGRSLTVCQGLLPGGGRVPLPGGGARGGGGIPACPEADPPHVNRMTNSSENITLATTSLRPVKIRYTELVYTELQKMQCIWFCNFFLHVHISSGSSGQVSGGGGENHEIYAAAFGGHLFL